MFCWCVCGRVELPLSALLDIYEGIRLARSQLPHHPQPWLQHLAHRVYPGTQRRVDQVGVALGGADLCVAEQPPDHFQRGAPGDQQRGEGVAQIVNADVGYVNLHAHPFPEPFKIDHRLTRDIAGEEKRTALGHGVTAQTDQGDGLVGDRYPVDAALLGIGGLLSPDGQIEVELVEGGGAGLAAAGPGQHAQANDPGGALIGIGAEGVGEALDFLEGQEPLAGGFGTLAEAGGGIVGAHFPHDREAEHLAQHLSHAICSHRGWLEGLLRGL